MMMTTGRTEPRFRHDSVRELATLLIDSRRIALGGGGHTHDFPVLNLEDSVCDPRNALVVGDEDCRLPQLSVEALEELEDLVTGLRVELSRRFVREDQGRVVRKGHRDGHSLLLATAELIGSMNRPLPEVDEIEELLGAPFLIR